MKLTMLFIVFSVAQSFGQWNLTGNSNATAASILGTTNSVVLNLATKNTKRLTIDTLGRIGIGTTTPTNILTVKGAGSTPAPSWVSAGAPLFVGFGETAIGNADYILSMAGSSANARPVFIGRKGRGTLAAPGVVANNDFLMSFLSSGYDGAAFQNPAGIDFYVDGTPSAGSVPARISFVTGSNSATRLERLKIGSTGNISFNNTQLYVQQSNGGAIGIGTTSPNASALVDMTSSNKGMLSPRMTKAQRLAILSPAVGLLLYQTDDVSGFYIYNNGWKTIRAIDSVNVFLGYRSGDAISNTFANTSVGNYSLQYLTTGTNNTATGYQALNATTVGFENAAFGAGALAINDSGNYNSAFGNISMPSNRTGNYNSSVGYYSLFLQNGNNNSALGFSAGDYTNGSSEGTFLGTLTQAGDNLSNITAVGYGATVTGSNAVRIGNTSVTSIGGQVGWSNFSDGRFKKNVKENVPGLEFITKLRPVTYNLDVSGIDNAFEATKANSNKHPKPQPSATDIKAKETKEKIIYSGFIAQDVEKTAKELNYDFSGVDVPKNKNDFYGLRYSEFVMPLVKSVQELNKMSNEKDEVIQSQNKRITDLEDRLTKLESLLINGKVASNTKEQNINLTSATLEQNVPNPPLNHNTKISYNIPLGSNNAELVVTNIDGKKVRAIKLNNTGNGVLNINTSGLSAGTYSYTLYVNGRMVETKKMIVSAN